MKKAFLPQSPLSPQWAPLFALSEQTGLSLQARLRQAVVHAILEGHLAPGSALPSSRELARALEISRNTVSAAYDQLIEEAYLETRPRMGVFVTSGAKPAQVQSKAVSGFNNNAEGLKTHGGGTRTLDWAQRVHRSLKGKPTLSKPDRWREFEYPFVYGTHDAQLFPTADFRECCTRSLARVQLSQWTPDLETADVTELLEQIRQRLLPKRGVFASPEEILVTVGAQHAYYLLADALLDGSSRLGMEEPGHPHARNAFLMRTRQVHSIPVDDEGVVVDGLPDLDYLFVTPSHQSPTTGTLSLDRREELLLQAKQKDFVLIEDDYEAENLYEGAPMPALKSMDRLGRVIYIGSLSKSLSPALRLGYIVAPKELIAELRLLRHAMVRHPSAFLQHAYALFISLGHHDSHARRVNQEMQQRLSAVAAALHTYLPQMRFTLPQGGASVWVQMPAGMDGAALAVAARGHGVLIEPGDVFFNEPPSPCPYFRLRLSSITLDQIGPGIEALSRAVRGLD
ncbi:PLP-dependent aminotransferase family protein [Variovorax sp. VNK109]|jgi:GntR family transcriptional regulator/MocR family aminotransferase|uniref:MocR-like pyridoxine biosynthesis transcription factor PdxR n=1 Tax=Variovorax sp. VNK109 TaxID=3400919 RepID=UPI003C0395CB